MKKNPKTGEKMFESVNEAGNYLRIDGEIDFKKELEEMMKPENLPITNMDQFSRHAIIIQALKRTPDKPDVNKMYKFVVYNISHMMIEGKTLPEAYEILSNILHVTVDMVKKIEKEAVKVIQAANMGDFFKGSIIA